MHKHLEAPRRPPREMLLMQPPRSSTADLGDLTIAATHRSGGHVTMHFTLRDGALPTWVSSLDVDVEAGAEMATIAGPSAT